MESEKKGIIVWALDSGQSPKDSRNIVEEMKNWATRLNCNIQPVSLYSNAVYNFPMEMSFEWLGEFEEEEEKYLAKYIEKLGDLFLPPKLLFVPTRSNRRMAMDLAKYASVEKAKLIFANTRAKKSWRAFRLGGFAEALIASSEVPVLLMNLRTKSSGSKPSFLFPTNFSRESIAALKTLTPWAKEFNSSMLLYNQIETPYSRSRAVESLLESFEKSRRKKGRGWVEFLNQQGVTGSVLIQRQNKDLVSDILSAAKKNKSGIIALASHPGRFAQTILGGTARDILLQANSPVLIFHRPVMPKKQIKKVSQMK